jgi:tetratricopeptide (TPR) repeat protein
MDHVDSLLDRNQYEEAAKVLEKQLTRLRVSGDRFKLLDTLCKLGICRYECERLADARSLLEEGLRLARETNDPQVRRFLHELSMVRMDEGRLDEAIDFCKEALHLDLADGGEGAMEMHTLSVLYQESGRFPEAMEVLQLVRESCEARQDLAGLGRCLNEIGTTCLGSGNLIGAVKHMVDSIEVKRRIGDARGIAHTSGVLGELLEKNPRLMMRRDVLAQLERLKSG